MTGVFLIFRSCIVYVTAIVLINLRIVIALTHMLKKVKWIDLLSIWLLSLLLGAGHGNILHNVKMLL